MIYVNFGFGQIAIVVATVTAKVISLSPKWTICIKNDL